MLAHVVLRVIGMVGVYGMVGAVGMLLFAALVVMAMMVMAMLAVSMLVAMVSLAVVHILRGAGIHWRRLGRSTSRHRCTPFHPEFV